MFDRFSMKITHTKSELCDGTAENCSDPKHLPYDEMKSIIHEAEKTESGSYDKLFRITETKQLLAPYNVDDDLMLQILYHYILLIKSKLTDNTTTKISTIIGLFGPSDTPDTGAPLSDELICHGSYCYNQGESEKATHALGCMPKNHTIGVVCLLCPDDYWMSINDPKYLEQVALVCIEHTESEKLR